MIDVTVLTPSLGYGRFIGDSVRSVIQQPGLTLQHIVQDAGSDDETLDVLRPFGDRIEWASERDLGQSDGLNKALARAQGAWVAWLNADEYYLPRALEILVETGESLGVDVVYGDSVIVDRDGRFLDLRPQHPFSERVLRLYGPFVSSVSLIIRRSALNHAPWDPSLKLVMDWDLYLRLASEGATFYHVAYPVGAFRQHPDQVSAQAPSPETRGVRARYGIPSARWWRRAGTTLHRARKLIAGSYARQLKARSLRGRDLRWFDDGTGAETFRLLMDRCYSGQARLRTSR